MQKITWGLFLISFSQVSSKKSWKDRASLLSLKAVLCISSKKKKVFLHGAKCEVVNRSGVGILVSDEVTKYGNCSCAVLMTEDQCSLVLGIVYSKLPRA